MPGAVISDDDPRWLGERTTTTSWHLQVQDDQAVETKKKKSDDEQVEIT